MPLSLPDTLRDRVTVMVAELDTELIAVRRHLHAHPELGREELRTTALLSERLTAAGLAPRLLPGSGLVCDIDSPGTPAGRRRLVLRADLDALPLADVCGRPWCSTVAGVSHACGHDVHAAIVLGAGLVLARMAAEGQDGIAVRLIFQAAEETQPGGALDAIAEGALDGVAHAFAVHCDPRFDVGTIGTRVGPITSASDAIKVRLTSPGGHTSRPHLTGDLVFALGEVITQVPAVLGRRLDPRWGVNLTWGTVHAGSAHNAIPSSGTLAGSLRCLDSRAWEEAARVVSEAIRQVVAPFAVEVEIQHDRGVPPVDNDEWCTTVLESAARSVLGEQAVLLTEQSLGGEDFAWYLTRVPGSMARLGTRGPAGPTYDLHQGDFDVDERAIAVGARLLAATALLVATGGAANIPNP